MAHRAALVLCALALTACASEDPDDASGTNESKTPASSPSATKAPAGDPTTVAQELTGYGVGLNGTDSLYGRLEGGLMETVTTMTDFTMMNAVVRDDGSAWVGSFEAVGVLTPDGKSKVVPFKGATSGVVVYDDQDAVWAYTFDTLHRIDVATRKVTGSWPVDGTGQLPKAEPMSAAGGSMYLNAEDGAVIGFDGQHATLFPKLPFQRSGWSFADVDAAVATETGVYVADLVSGKIAVYDTATKKVTEVKVARPLDTKGNGETGRTVSLVGDDEGGAWIAFGAPTGLGGSDPTAAKVVHADPGGTVEEGSSPEPLDAIYDETDGLLLTGAVIGAQLLDPATGEAAPMPVSLGALLEALGVAP